MQQVPKRGQLRICEARTCSITTYHALDLAASGLQRSANSRQPSTKAGGLPTQPGESDEASPYVGIYSAHAVACFAFGHRVPVVDLSIVRVLSRLAGTEPPSDITESARGLGERTGLSYPDKEVKEHNYGLLDFAADTCQAKSPRCDEVPTSAWLRVCQAPVTHWRARQTQLGGP